MKPSVYGPFPYSPMIRRPKVIWPNGARLAFWIIPNIEFFSLMEKVPAGAGGSGVQPPDVPSWAVRDYGNRVGVFRLMDVMERYGVRGTVALNSDLCEHHHEIIEEGLARNWEFMGHNESNTRRLNEAEPGAEAGIVQRTVSTIGKATGVKPRGWLSSGLQETWDTLEHLSEAGVDYVCDWTNDDQPYAMTLDNGRDMLSVPYSHEINDKPAFDKFHMSGPEFGAMIKRQFDVLWREGEQSARVMAIALHPYLTGVPHRIDAFEEALAYICRHEGVWLTTGSEIADAWRQATSLSKAAE
jgi:allantoinase